MNYTKAIASLTNMTEDQVRWELDALHSLLTMTSNASDTGIFEGMSLGEKVDAIWDVMVKPHQYDWGTFHPMQTCEGGTRLAMAFKSLIWDENDCLTHPSIAEVYEALVK